MTSIRLHPKYGVNPTLPICLFCGQDKGEIALLGDAYNGEAPMRMLIDSDPCDKCQAGMALGVAFFEVDDRVEHFPDKRVPVGYLPTRGGHVRFKGRWAVLKREAAERMGIKGEDKHLISTADAEELGLFNQGDIA